jgi:hypothetical protein
MSASSGRTGTETHTGVRAKRWLGVVVDNTTLWALIATSVAVIALAITVVNAVGLWLTERYRLRLLKKLVDTIDELHRLLEHLERERRFINVATNLMERVLKDDEDGEEE